MFKNAFSILRKNHGVSLIEVMVTVGVMGIVSLGTMSVVEQVSKTVGTADANNDFQQIADELELMINDASMCGTLMANIDPPDDDNDPDSEGVWDTTSVVGEADDIQLNMFTGVLKKVPDAAWYDTHSRRLTITKLTIGRPDDINLGGGVNKKNGILELRATIGQPGSVYGSSTKVRKYNFFYETNADDSAITKCSSNNVTNICSDFGGIWNSSTGTCDMKYSACEDLGGYWLDSGGINSCVRI